MKTSDRRRTILICIALVLVAAAVYSPIVDFDFVGYDDSLMVTDNQVVRQGLTRDGTRWAFGLGEKAGTYWHPLTWLSHMLDCELWGLEPGPHHATNIILHAANTVLLFLVFSAMTGAPWRSALAAGLFALHPVNVESVAWVASRKNLLSTTFLLLTVAAYHRYTLRPGVARYLGVFVLFAAGLLAKPMLVTVPILLLLLDFWPLRRMTGDGDRPRSSWARLVAEKVPLLTLSLISVVVSLRSLPSGPEAAPGPDLALRLANVPVAIVKYLMILIAPMNLSVFYPFPEAIAPANAIAATALLVGFTVLVFALRRRYPFLLFGWLWFGVALGPVSGLVQAGVWPQMADRWAYVPFISLFVALAWSLGAAVDRRRLSRPAATLTSCLVLAVFGVATSLQLGHWRSASDLFSHALELNPENVVALTGLADARLEEGRVREARTLYAEALRLQAGNSMAHNGIGVALMMLGRAGEAEEHFRQAMTSDRSAFARLNLAALLSEAGRFAEAISLYEAMLAEDATSMPAHLGLAGALARNGRFDRALVHFREAVRLDPASGEARLGLERCLDTLEKSGAGEEETLP